MPTTVRAVFARLLIIFDKRSVQSAIGILLTMIALVSLTYSWQASSQEQRSNKQLRSYVRCQSEWTSFLYQAISANRTASRAATQALDDLINTISATPPPTREQSVAAIERYKEARAKQIQSQQENPLPEPPKSVCQLEET